MIKGILANTGSNVLVLLLKMVLTFIMAPILVHSLGNYDYGLWEMIGAVIGYMGMLDLGIKPAIGRYAAQHHARNEAREQQLMFSSAFIFMLLVGLLLSMTFVIWGVYFPHSLAEESTDAERYTLLCLILAAQFIFIFPGYVAESVLEGLQKFNLKNIVTIINSVVGALLIYNFITPENGLVLLAGLNALGLTVKYIVYFIILRNKKLGALRPFGLAPSWIKLKELLQFGAKALVQGIATRLENATDSLVIGAILGPAMVPFYSIPANLVGYIRTLGHTLTQVFMPLFSQLSAQNNQKLIVTTYFQGSKYVISFVLMMSIGAAFLGADFINLWMGPEYAEQAGLLVLILVTFTALPMLNPFASRYLTALNEHAIFAKLTPISAILNVSLSIVLAHKLGIVGVALGSLITVGIFIPVYLQRCCNHLGVKKRDYLMASVLPNVVPGIVMSLTLWQVGENYIISSYLDLLLIAFLAGMAFVIMFFAVGINKTERALLKTKVCKIL